MPRSSALRAYRRRVKTSVCRGLKRRTCKGKMGCKYVSGSKRKFCRKSGNTKRYSMSLRKMRGGTCITAPCPGYPDLTDCMDPC